MTATDKERLTLVKNFPSRPLAEAGRRLLEQENIGSIIQSADLVGAGTAGGCDLYVKQKDAERARELLEEFYDSI